MKAVLEALRALPAEQRLIVAEALQRSAPIAVVGMACRLPGASDVEGYWRMLLDGKDAVSEIPEERWPLRAYFDADPDRPGRTDIRRAGLVPGLDRFDPDFFAIDPEEAQRMDPQQRLFLEVAWEALEDAGIDAGALEGTRAGVFAGVYLSDALMLQLEDPATVNAHTMTGSYNSIVAGRLAYVLGLRGPAMSVDTACSSSLVAVHLAIQSLRTRESDVAFAGGVHAILSPETNICVGKVKVTSPHGRCKTFDDAADGIARGEGCGVVVLKRFSDAVRDGDRIWAVLRGSALNHDGRSNGLTAPSGRAQELLLRDVLTQARLTPQQITYVETHGTGTKLGDLVEFGALAEVLGGATGSPCYLGAVKTNIGHTESTAGIAGLIKAILCVKHRVIPKNLHYETPNALIPLEGSRFVIPQRTTPWEVAPDARRYAGVSSFGISGTNAHVIVEEAGEPPPQKAGAAEATSSPSSVHFLPISARSPEALHALAGAYVDRLGQRTPEESLEDVCWSARARRTHHPHRVAVVGETAEELVHGLSCFQRGEPTGGLSWGVAVEGQGPKLVAVFSGQGGDREEMGQTLYRTEPVFREALDRVDAAMRVRDHEGGAGIVDWLLQSSGEADPSAAPARMTQPALFAIQIALWELWRSWGLSVDAVVGHSRGEIAAACVAGVLSLEDASRMVCRRAQLMARVSGRGRMALVDLSALEAAEAIASEDGRVDVGAINGPRATVLSGDAAAVARVLEKLKRRDVQCRDIRGEIAFHSKHMAELADELARDLKGLRPGRATVPICSTVTGRWIEGTDMDAAYWVRNMVNPVRFWDATQELAKKGAATFLELSGHPALLGVLRTGLRDVLPGVRLEASLRRGESEPLTLQTSLGSLFAHGHVRSPKREAGGARFVPLPAYPWQRKRFWFADVVRSPALHPGARLGSARATAIARQEGAPAHALAFSAKSESALDARAARLGTEIAAHPSRPAADIARHASAADERLPWRAVVLASSAEGLREGLSLVTRGGSGPTVLRSAHAAERPPKIAFLFTGQGSQYPGMGRQLYEMSPRFKQNIDRCSELLEGHLDLPLKELMFGDHPKLYETEYAQPAIFALEYSLADLWRSWGIEPAYVAGHSLGEYAAICTAGLLSLEEAIVLVAKRGKLLQRLPERGLAAMVAANAAAVEDRLRRLGGGAVVAAINSPRRVLISGTATAVEAAVADFTAQGIEASVLKGLGAAHSPLVEPVLPEFDELGATLRAARRAATSPPPSIGMVSTLFGRLATSGELTEPDYFCRQLRQPVQFVEGMHALQRLGCDAFVEIGPRHTLVRLGEACLGAERSTWLPSLSKERHDWVQLLESVSQLYVRGAEPRWERAIGRAEARRGAGARVTSALVGRRIRSASKDVQFEAEVSCEALSWLVDHRLYGAIVMPGAAHIARILTAEMRDEPAEIDDITFERPLVLASEQDAPVCQMIVAPRADGARIVEIWTSAGAGEADDETRWIRNVAATLPPRRSKSMDAPEGVARPEPMPLESITGPDFYAARAAWSLDLGPSFRWIARLHISKENAEAWAEMRAPTTDEQVEPSAIHPGLLDSCIQTALELLDPSQLEGDAIFVPVSVEKARIHRRPPAEPLFSHVRLRHDTDASAPVVDVRLGDDAGVPVVELLGVRLQRAPREALLREIAPARPEPEPKAEGPADWFFEQAWERVAQQPHGATDDASGTWFVFTDASGAGRAIGEELARRGGSVIAVRRGERYSAGDDGVELDPTRPEDFDRLFRTYAHATEPIASAVFLWGLDAPALAATTPTDTVFGEVRRGTGSLLHVMQAVVRLSQENGEGTACPLTVVTRSAQAAGSGGGVDVLQSPLWGMGRVFGNEHDLLWGGLIDLAPEPSADEAKHVVDELLRPDRDLALAFRGGERFGARLRRTSRDGHPPSVRPDATYVVTGGLGALGFLVIRWLLAQGARHVLVLGRGDSAAARTRLAGLATAGQDVVIRHADVGDLDELRAVLAETSKTMPAVRGIVHAAGILDDAAILEQSVSRLERVLAPKVKGAWNLHLLFEHAPLDFFVLFSSVGALYGTAGQAPYAAANAFLDGLAAYRRSHGQVASSIAWGPWSAAGMAEARGDHLHRRWGFESFDPEQGTRAFASVFGTVDPNLIVMRADWEQTGKSVRARGLRQLLAAFVREDGPRMDPPASASAPAHAAGPDDLVARLRASPEAARRQILSDFISRAINVLIGEEEGAPVLLNRRLADVGVDSILSIDLVRYIQHHLKLALPSNLVFERPTVELIIDYILAQQGSRQPQP